MASHRQIAPAALAALALTAALAGCGSATNGPLGATASARLHGDIASIRTALDGGYPRLALTRISALSSDINRLADAGQLAPADAAVLRLDARRLSTAVADRLPPATATASAPRPASPSPAATPAATPAASPAKAPDAADVRATARRDWRGFERAVAQRWALLIRLLHLRRGRHGGA